jgi:hypothetical protein
LKFGTAMVEGDRVTLSDAAPVGACPCCGNPLDERDRHTRFGWPDAVFALPAREQTAGSWLNEEDPRSAAMMEVPGAGSFVRALLPVRLTEGFSVTFGVWLRVSADELRAAFDLFWSPEYAKLQLDGHLANAIKPWDVLGAPVQAKVHDPDALPECTGSDHQALHQMMTQEWPHAAVLAAHFG